MLNTVGGAGVVSFRWIVVCCWCYIYFQHCYQLNYLPFQ